MTISRRSAKQKGRLFQKYVVGRLLKAFPEFDERDISSVPASLTGEDILLSPEARKAIGLSIECKRVEKFQMWSSWAQASSNAPDGAEPCVVTKRNLSPTLAIVEWDFLIDLIRRANG